MYYSYSDPSIQGMLCTSGAKYAQTPPPLFASNNNNNNHSLNDVIMTSDVSGTIYHSIYSYEEMTPMTSSSDCRKLSTPEMDFLSYQSSVQDHVISPAAGAHHVLSSLYPLETIRYKDPASEDHEGIRAITNKKQSTKRKVKVERVKRTRTKPDLCLTRFNSPVPGMKRRYKEDDHVTQWLNEQTCDGNVKRRRRVSRTQRLAANERERKRMDSLNHAFSELRSHIPVRSHNRRLSRIQTLRYAIDYIALMLDLLRQCDEQELT